MATSSAEPEKLFRYSGVGLSLDSEVKSESAQLRGSLAHFESACREPAFRLSVAHHADTLGSYGSECETLDGWVQRVGAGFQAADSGGFRASSVAIVPAQVYTGRHLSGMQQQSVPADLLSVPSWLINSALPWLRDAGSSILDGSQLAAAAFVAAFMRAGALYRGQTLIDLPDRLAKAIGMGARQVKGWAGINPAVTHFRADFTTMRSLLKQPGPLTKVGTALAALELAAWWSQDFRSYQGTKLVSSLAIDGVLVALPIVAAPTVGAAVGAFLGTVLFPGPGTAAGAAIGAKAALVTTAVFPIAAKWAIDKFDLRQKGTDLLDNGIIQPAANIIFNGVDAVDEAMRSTTDSIASSMDAFSDWVWSSSRRVAGEVGL